MSNEIDRPLPVSGWGPVEGAPVTTQQPAGFFFDTAADRERELQERNTWRESFKQLGHNVEEALGKHLNSESFLLSKKLLTIEDVYKHLQAMQAFVHQEQNTPTQKEQITTEKSEKAKLVREAQTRWRQAILDRKKAIAGWDEYVASMRQAYSDAKDQ